MNKDIADIYYLIQELSWYFGNQGFEGECCEDLTLIEYMALKKVYDYKNITIQEIGNSLNITKSGISKIIDRLESKEYVTKERSLQDGRVCCVVASEKGLTAIKNTGKQYSEYLGEVLDFLEPSSLKNFKNVLESLVSGIQKKGYIKQK